MNRYRIELDRIEPNGDVHTIVEYRQLKATKSIHVQMNNLINQIIEELKYYQVPHKCFTVSHV